MRTYVLTDLHGRFDLFEQALAWIAEDAKTANEHRLIFLGDYVDRGPQSRQIVERLMAGPANWICLKGNHEQMMCEACQQPDAAQMWLVNGGAQTMRSYGLEPGQKVDLPASHLLWLNSLPLYVEDDRRFYVHAGVLPGYTLDEMKAWPQHRQETIFLWIRSDFLTSGHNWGKVIVHGHTPQRSGLPEVKGNRINLDTGAVWTDILTIAAFESDSDEVRIKQFQGELVDG